MSREMRRPLSVYGLVVLSVGCSAAALIAEPQINFWDFFAVGINAVLVRGLWTGESWAFSMSFMFASLCVALTFGAALVQAFLMELDVSLSLLWAAAASVLWITLLILPSTKRFAGLVA